MYCRDCHRWDVESRRCLDGKVNPMSWEESVNVANVLGVRAICVFNDYRERLVGSRLSQVRGSRLEARSAEAAVAEEAKP